MLQQLMLLVCHLRRSTAPQTLRLRVRCWQVDEVMELDKCGCFAKNVESVEYGPSESGSCEKSQQRRMVPDGW